MTVTKQPNANTIKLTESSALMMSIGMYFGLMAGVIALAILIHELAKAFDATPSYTQSLELAAYTATPLFMVGFAAFYPVLWFVMAVILWSMGMGPVYTL
jgi:uncharacterized membrane protein